MKRALIGGFAAIGFIAVNAVLIHGVANDGADQYARIEKAIRLVDQCNANLDASVLSLRLGLHSDYDEMTRCESELDAALPVKKTRNAFVANDANTTNLADLIHLKTLLASDFKANHAVVRNALAGFQHCLRKWRESGGEERYNVKASRLEILGLRFAISGNHGDKEPFQNAIRELETAEMETSTTGLNQSDLQLVLKHAHQLVNRRIQLDTTIASLIDIPIRESTKQLMEQASRTFHSRSTTVWWYRAGLCVSILITLALCLYQYAALVKQERAIQRANHTLEQKVEARTVELANTNRDLESAIAESEKLALVARYTDNAVIITDSEGRVEWVNHGFERITKFRSQEVVGECLGPFLHGPGTNSKSIAKLKNAIASQCGVDVEILKYRKTGEPFWMSIEGRAIFDENNDFTCYILIESDITSRVEAENHRRELNDRLVEASRLAGIAEVATGVLHNVGNVLNSVNVSASMIQQKCRESALKHLEMLSGLLSEHEDDFTGFVTDDPRGQQLPTFVGQVSSALRKEREQISVELSDLVSNVDHIKDIVATQQSSAKLGGVTETIDIKQLVETAITASKGTLSNHGVTVVTDLDEDLPSLVSDKHNLLQILVNLISNAKDSLKESNSEIMEIAISARVEKEFAVINVKDSGLGIAPANLAKIFQHGFTTKATGHGFGLHSSANFASELGGSMSVTSDGLGKGATFRLSIPLCREECESTDSEETATLANLT